MTDPSLPADITQLSFEDAIAELEAIVRRLEEGKGKLDEAIASYERGTLLRRHCESRLAEAQAKIDRIVQAGDGSLSTQPLDAD